jgi:zinc protease
VSWVRLPPLRRAILPNGLAVIIAERRALPLVTMRLAMRAGSAQDPGLRPGLAAFTARLLRHGAGDRDEPAFAEALDEIGGLFGASIGLDQLALDAEFTTETWEQGRGLVLDALLRPRFPEAAVARERARSMAEIEQSHDEPEHVASRAFQRLLFEAHAYGHPAEGTRTALEATTRDDVATFASERLVPDGAVLVVVGDVDAGRELDRWSEALAGWRALGRVASPPEDATPATGHRMVLVQDEGAGQAQWRAGNVAFRRATPYYPHLVLANTILGGGFTSRLVQEIRVERGLTYGIGSRFVLPFSRGPFEMASFTKSASLAELHAIAVGTLASFREKGADQAELDAARAYVLGHHVRRFETPEGLASALADAEVHGLGEESITGFRAALESIGADELNAALPDLLPGELLTVVVGDADTLRDECARMAGDTGRVELASPDFVEKMTP